MKTKSVVFAWATLELADDPWFATVEYESDNFRRLLQEQWSLNPRVYLDVGAHQGIYTTFLATIAQQHGQVFAFEPNPDNWSLLLKNSVVNPCGGRAPVAVYPCAVSHAMGQVEMKCWRSKPAATGQGQLTQEGDAPEFTIPVSTVALDDLSFPHPVEFIKIDVEHWEMSVLAGALQTILEHHPRMLIEIHNNVKKQQIMAFCEAYGWALEEWRAGIPAMGHISDFLFVRT